jgi:uncharacterized protein YktB (UPF0637 family)
VEFSGFTQADFEIFAIPDFEGRMGAIRAQIRPKLVALGADLNATVERITGIPTFPHAAQHMRRRVNPPVETWAAFTRDKRGYKRWTHYRIAIGEGGVRVTVFVEDDADDKSRFGAVLETAGSKLVRQLGKEAGVQWYTLDPAGPVPNAQVKADAVKRLGASLQRLKTAKFQAGVPLDGAAAAAMSPAQFEAWAAGQVEVLKPLYLAGAMERYRP